MSWMREIRSYLEKMTPIELEKYVDVLKNDCPDHWHEYNRHPSTLPPFQDPNKDGLKSILLANLTFWLLFVSAASYFLNEVTLSALAFGAAFGSGALVKRVLESMGARK